MRLAYVLIPTLLVPSFTQAQEYITLSDKITPRYLVEEFGQVLGATEAARARPLLETALELIANFEGWVPSAYNDPAGYCTIGYGHLIALEQCSSSNIGEFSGELTLDEGRGLLESDTVGARLTVQRLVNVDLNDRQFGALTSFVFNVGGENFRRSTLLRLLNDGNYLAASQQLPRWIRAGGKVYNGLINRRACEAALFNGEAVTGPQGRFNRALCAPLGVTPPPGEIIDIDIGEQ